MAAMRAHADVRKFAHAEDPVFSITVGRHPERFATRRPEA
ncbi:MAG: hypothetical protein QOF10_2286 [Kribbellaceae bacterium]|nr:hypothetical protein [Kribbellaceae bacterium]